VLGSPNSRVSFVTVFEDADARPKHRIMCGEIFPVAAELEYLSRP